MAGDNLKQLLELMKARPDLPVLPMVWGEIALEQNRYWTASWEKAEITRYWLGDEGVYFYDEKDMDDCLNDANTVWPYDDLDTEEKALEVYRGLPWKEAIVVFIGMPEG